MAAEYRCQRSVMKVLHLIYTNGIAGAEKYLRHLLPRLKEHGIECHLVLVCSPGFEKALEQYCEESRLTGIPTMLIVSGKLRFVSTARKVAKYMAENDLNYLHSHLLNSDIIATLVKILFRRSIKIISTKHGYTEKILSRLTDKVDMRELLKQARRDIYFYVSKFAIRYTDHNYAVSKAAAKLYADLELVNPEMPHIYHGVDVKPLVKSKSLSPYRISSPQLICVGRLEEVKGTRYLLEAMPAVIEKFPETSLLLMGDGSDKIKLQDLAEKLGIGKNVKFLGFTTDPYSFVCNSDIVVQPSLFETFGLVYIEAFALKTPVIAFDTPAGNEIMENGVTAILVEARDVKALSEKILFLLENPDEASALAERAFLKYQQSYNADRMAAETAAFYHSISA